MNCKPNQLAMIVLPKDQARFGLESLNGRIVRTIALLPRTDMPIWEVSPRQTATINRPGVDRNGEICWTGETLRADGIPDAYLVPFDAQSDVTGERVDVDDNARQYHLRMERST